jgi:hypothetical protein
VKRLQIRDRRSEAERRRPVSSELSVAQVLAKLEAQMAYHRERESHHADRESFHQEKRATHAADYEEVAHHYDAFKATAGAAAEIAVRATVSAPPPPEPPSPELVEDEEPPDILQSSRLVARAVAQWPVGEPFTATQIAAEVNRLYPRELRQPVVPRLAATALRRLCSHGRIRLVRRGVPYHEAVYSRG